MIRSTIRTNNGALDGYTTSSFGSVSGQTHSPDKKNVRKKQRLGFQRNSMKFGLRNINKQLDRGSYNALHKAQRSRAK